jgi:hypothetical protein
MFYVGLDMHVKHITTCVLDAQTRPALAGNRRGLNSLRTSPTKAPWGRLDLRFINSNAFANTVGIESGFQVVPRSASWRSNAAHSNGANRMLSYGAPPTADDAEWTHGIPAFISLSTLDGDPLMDARAASLFFRQSAAKRRRPTTSTRSSRPVDEPSCGSCSRHARRRRL